MPDNHVYRIIQVAGSSENSIEDAIQNAVGRASRTLRQVGWFEVLETRGHVEGRQGGALPGHRQSRVHPRRRRLARRHLCHRVQARGRSPSFIAGIVPTNQLKTGLGRRNANGSQLVPD